VADPRLNIRITAELGEIRKALDGLNGNLTQFKTQAEKSTQRMGAGLQFAKRAAFQLGVALGAAFSVRSLAAAADEAAELNARLKLATKTTEEFNKAQRGTFDIAQRTRTSWKATGELYARVERSTRDLALNQATILQLTESINQAAQISGGGQGAEAALFQLSQGLASGQLRGEELNSVLEQTPRLAQAIADGMDVPVGKLRELAAEGKVTSQELLRAVLKQSETLQKEFDQLPTTISGAMTKIRNAFTKMVSDADTASGASRELVKVLEDLAAFLNDPATAEGFAVLATAVARLIKLAGEAAVEFAELGRMIGYFAARVTGNTSALDDLEQDIKDVDRALKNSFLGKPTKYLFTSEAELNRIKAQLVAERDALLAAQGVAGNPAASDPIGIPTGGGGGGGGKGKASAFRGDLELLRDSVERSLAELDRLYEGHNTSLADYFAEKQRLQLAGIDAAIEQAQAELRVADSAEAQAKAMVEIQKLQRDRAEVGPAVAREQAKAEEELAAALGQVHIRMLELQGDTVAARTAEIEEEFAGLIMRLQQAGDEGGVAIVRKLINAEVAKAELTKIRDGVQSTIDDLRGTEDLLAAQQDAGQIMPHDAERQLQELRERSIEQLQRYRSELAAIPESMRTPETIAAIQQVDTEIARVTASMNKMRQQVADQAINSLTTFFTDLASGSKSAGDALRDFVVGFIQGMAQIAARALATYLVLQMLDAIYPGLGKATAATMGVAVNHSGGVVGAGGPMRQVDPMLFAGAPRFHTGGVVGLRQDEVPAILQTGEEVLSRGDPRNVMNGGGRTGAGTGTRVINVIDPSMVQDYMDSPSGEETVLNIIGRNPGRVKQVLG